MILNLLAGRECAFLQCFYFCMMLMILFIFFGETRDCPRLGFSVVVVGKCRNGRPLYLRD
jgi:hypothetical protein